MNSPIDLAAHRQAPEETQPSRIYRRVLAITLELDSPLAMGSQARGFLDQVTGAIAGVCQQAAAQGAVVTIVATKQNRAMGGQWMDDQQIILPGQH